MKGNIRDFNLLETDSKFNVFLFYPCDWEPESLDLLSTFCSLTDQLKTYQCSLYGCSTDSVSTHLNWIKTELGDNFNFPLISDPTGQLAERFSLYNRDERLCIRGVVITDNECNMLATVTSSIDSSEMARLVCDMVKEETDCSEPVIIKDSSNNLRILTLKLYCKLESKNYSSTVKDLTVQGVFQKEKRELNVHKDLNKLNVFAFYPCDWEPESLSLLASFCPLVDQMKIFQCSLYGCSTDSVSTHLNWIKTELGDNFNFPLLSDPTGQLADRFSLYDREERLCMRGVVITDNKCNMLATVTSSLDSSEMAQLTFGIVEEEACCSEPLTIQDPTNSLRILIFKLYWKLESQSYGNSGSRSFQQNEDYLVNKYGIDEKEANIKDNIHSRNQLTDVRTRSLY